MAETKPVTEATINAAVALPQDSDGRVELIRIARRLLAERDAERAASDSWCERATLRERERDEARHLHDKHCPASHLGLDVSSRGAEGLECRPPWSKK